MPDPRIFDAVPPAVPADDYLNHQPWCLALKIPGSYRPDKCSCDRQHMARPAVAVPEGSADTVNVSRALLREWALLVRGVEIHTDLIGATDRRALKTVWHALDRAALSLARPPAVTRDRLQQWSFEVARVAVDHEIGPSHGEQLLRVARELERAALDDTGKTAADPAAPPPRSGPLNESEQALLQRYLDRKKAEAVRALEDRNRAYREVTDAMSLTKDPVGGAALNLGGYAPVAPPAPFPRRAWKLTTGGLIHLITPEEFAALPKGVRLTAVDGKVAIKGLDRIDDDTRGGFMAWGRTDHEIASERRQATAEAAYDKQFRPQDREELSPPVRQILAQKLDIAQKAIDELKRLL